MKFIDLYNRTKNTEFFKEKQRIFNAWVRLAKNNPKKYKVTFDSRNYRFDYFESEECGDPEGGSYYDWKLKGNSLCGFGKYSKMSDFEKC